MWRSWFFAGENELAFTRKNLPRLAILRSLIGRGCALFGESDLPWFPFLIRRGFRSDSSVSVKGFAF